MNRPFHVKFQTAVMLCFVLLFAIMTIVNAPIVIEPAGRYLRGETTFGDMKETIATGYTSDALWQKNSFINLNGLFARAACRRVYSGVTLLKNGMLTFDEPLARTSMEPTAQRMGEFSDWLKGMNIPFVYAMVPFKVDHNPQLLPEGIDFHLGENGTELLEGLEKRGVETIDLREDLSLSVEQVNRYFYRTDHHWNAAGAFVAFGTIMQKLHALDTSIRTSTADATQWEHHSLAHWSLGSEGKHVGSLFAGTDALDWYTPKFETKMSCIVPHHGEIFKGSFEDANLRKRYIERSDYFNDSAYCVYIGGDYPLVEHRNAQAPNKRRVLLIKDSFMLPVQAFLSTAFSEVDVIDPRHYTASSLAEYCAWTMPDLVIMMTLPSIAMGEKYTNFGVDAAPPARPLNVGKIFMDDYTFQVDPADSDHNFVRVPMAPEPGITYRISFKDVDMPQGQSDGFSILLYNWTNGSIVRHQIFDIDYCRRTGGDEWFFTVPTDACDYGLLIYAGVYGHTYDNGLRLTGVQLARMT